MMKNEMSARVRGVLRGRQSVCSARRQGLTLFWNEKVKLWRELAWKYRRGNGLSEEELRGVLKEIEGKKTNLDLILEVTVRNEELRDASSEVRVFLDRLLEDLAVNYPPRTKVDFGLGRGGDEGKKISKNREKELDFQPPKIEDRRSFEERLAESLAKRYKISEKEKVTKDLAKILAKSLRLQQLRDDLDKKNVEEKLKNPKQIFDFLDDYLRRKIDWATPKEDSPFRSLQIKVMGSE